MAVGLYRVFLENQKTEINFGYPSNVQTTEDIRREVAQILLKYMLGTVQSV